MHSVDPACESFRLAPYFYCDKTNHQISVQMCHARVARKFEECRKCKQRGEVLVAEALGGAVVPQQPQVQRRLKLRAGGTLAPPRPAAIPEEPRRVLKRRIAITL